jgi:hypothetical protein
MYHGTAPRASASCLSINDDRIYSHCSPPRPSSGTPLVLLCCAVLCYARFLQPDLKEGSVYASTEADDDGDTEHDNGGDKTPPPTTTAPETSRRRSSSSSRPPCARSWRWRASPSTCDSIEKFESDAAVPAGLSTTRKDLTYMLGHAPMDLGGVPPRRPPLPAGRGGRGLQGGRRGSTGSIAAAAEEEKEGALTAMDHRHRLQDVCHV